MQAREVDLFYFDLEKFFYLWGIEFSKFSCMTDFFLFITLGKIWQWNEICQIHLSFVITAVLDKMKIRINNKRHMYN